jgi:6-phosphogluconolactonase
MKRPANSYQSFFAVAVLGFLILGIAVRSSADTKPKYVYVTDSGQYAGQSWTGPGNVNDTQQRFQLTATAICTNYACASPISISGSFTVFFYSTFATVRSGGIALSDPSDLASSPLTLLNSLDSAPGAALSFGPASPSSHVLLNFPFTTSYFPTNYSGGMLCTVAFTTGCSNPSTMTIAAADQSPSLLAITGGLPLTAMIQSGTIIKVASPQGSNSVSGYAVDGTTGALTPLPGSPFAVGSDPSAVAVNPSNNFVYVANHLSNNVSVFAVDSSTGSLSQVPGSPFAAGTGPSSIALDPTGMFVYVGNQGSNDVSAFTTDSETGFLTPVGGSPFSTDFNPISLTMDPLGRFLYVTNSDLYPNYIYSWDTVVYTIDHSTGVLNRVPGSQYAGEGPLGGAIDPSGQYFFSINYFIPDWGVSPAAINGTTGALTYSLNGSGTPLPGALAIHPSGKFVYVTDVSFDYVVAFNFDSVTGAMTPIPGSAQNVNYEWIVPAGPYATGDAPLSITVDPSGKFVYVANEFSNDISGYSVNPTSGALTPIAGTPFAAGIGPSSLAIVSSSTVSFETFLAKAEIDEDRETSFRVEGFFTLGAGSNGIYPLSEPVQVQVGSLSLTIPAGSMRQRGKEEFVFEGKINGTDVKMAILRWDVKGQGKGKPSNDYLFVVEGKGRILSGITNPVTIGVGIGDDEGSTSVTADIDR